MKKKIRRMILIYFTAWFLAVFGLFSSTQAMMIKLSLEKLTKSADAIVLGEVSKVHCTWSMDKSIIVTIITLQIHEILKGDVDNTQLFIQYRGGSVGDINLKVSDMPMFQPNEIVLVFLKSIVNVNDMRHSSIIGLNILPAFSVFGASQGKYSIDSNGIAQKSGYTLISKDSEPDKSLSIDELKRKIKHILDLGDKYGQNNKWKGESI